jgi:hypothetical protein
MLQPEAAGRQESEGDQEPAKHPAFLLHGDLNRLKWDGNGEKNDATINGRTERVKKIYGFGIAFGPSGG